jgi:hypothetical protein
MVRGKRAPSAARFALLLAVVGCGGRSNAQDPPPPVVPARSLFTAPLAGEKVSVLPLTMILADGQLGTESPFLDRPTSLRWSDSLLGHALENRAPDVDWVLPDELRAIAKRAPTVAPDPDRMGQSVMGSPRLDFMPDPLRSYARSLVAIAGGRRLLIPAAYTFARTPEGKVKAELAIVLADARNGQVTWRTLAVGEGDTAEAAVAAAFKVMLPLPTDMQ